MSEDHLSPLQLDELAAGLGPDQPHLRHCPRCSDRLAAVRRANAAFLERPQAVAMLEKLSPPAPRSAPLRLIIGVAIAMAAALVLFIGWPNATETRIKGAPSIALQNANGQTVTHATPGQRLTLRITGAGFVKGTVWSTGADGKREQLWSGTLPRAEPTDLLQVEVTPGDVELTAEFEDGSRHATATARLQVP